jgi:hypothetical protein
MAIKRCPYCKAIIDEREKYCNNCGTQLLFPEDELVEEDIPGDKIIDEEEESSKTDEEDEDEEIETGEIEDEDEVEPAEEEEKKEKEETDGLKKFAEIDKEQTETDEEELELVGEEKGEFGELPPLESERDLEERTPTGEITEEEDTGKEDKELQDWLELKEEIARKAEEERLETRPQESLISKGEIGEKKYELSLEEDELVFKTKELDQLTQTVDEEKKEKIAEERAPETKEDLPPWASGMKESTPSVTPDQLEELEAEPRPISQEWTTDSGIGIPEKVTQATLPFADTSSHDEERGEEERINGIAREAAIRPPRSFSSKLKAKGVDLIFITALWLIALGFTAGVIGVSFFKIIFVAPLPVLAFYLILLLLYFFLFLYFLGETLGDHYFSAED